MRESNYDGIADEKEQDARYLFPHALTATRPSMIVFCVYNYGLVFVGGKTVYGRSEMAKEATSHFGFDRESFTVPPLFEKAANRKSVFARCLE